MMTFMITIKAIMTVREMTWAPLHKTLINGKLYFNGNYHRILDADWLWCLVVMVATIESKVTINGKFYATGPWLTC